MIIKPFLRILPVLGLLAGLAVGRDAAGSHVSSLDRYSWGANIGWFDWLSDGVHGAVFTPYAASGFIYSANIGWIYLGSGAPTQGLHYSNKAAGDCGVNVDAQSDPDYFVLSGYAWSANVGWINFNIPTPDQPRINKKTGILTGAVWGANIGWLQLNSMPTAQVNTGLIYADVWDWKNYR